MKIFLAILIFLTTLFMLSTLIVLTEVSRNETIKINCEVSEFSPDISNKQKELCRGQKNVQ